MAGGVVIPERSIAAIAQQNIDALETTAALMTLSGVLAQKAGMIEATERMAMTSALLTDLMATARGCDFMQIAELVAMRAQEMADNLPPLAQA